MSQSTSLADLLERVLDKGVVIAGDITVLVADVELLTIKIRLLVASVDKAMEIGVNWWQDDPYLNIRAKQLVERNRELETELASLRQANLETIQTRLDVLESALKKPGPRDSRRKSEKP
ncbi:MAG: gas vesicle protein [Firmicutes bacterium]|uniref:Gas vesicle protein n=1 Tax=Sulfobacillus benefaciens TaxID=453960 RepID=A0A2T2WWV9_9FIRM|nr:gas vesicle protein [Bacillota bacterium]MCL5013741.1 gas vesicle protein [Bacillota bacterium]PSR26725.1 MAG: gas vesicle protein [Sulfobacillus benefaciens]